MCFCFRPLQILISLHFFVSLVFKIEALKESEAPCHLWSEPCRRATAHARRKQGPHQRAREPRRPLVMGRCQLWCRERIPGPFELFIDVGCGLQSQLTPAMSSPPAAPQCPPAVPSRACLLPHLQGCPALSWECPSLSSPGSDLLTLVSQLRCYWKAGLLRTRFIAC